MTSRPNSTTYPEHILRNDGVGVPVPSNRIFTGSSSIGDVELGRAVFVQHVINSACRKAARMGSTTGSTTATVKAKTLEILGSAIKTTSVQVYVKDASTFDSSNH